VSKIPYPYDGWLTVTAKAPEDDASARFVQRVMEFEDRKRWDAMSGRDQFLELARIFGDSWFMPDGTFAPDDSSDAEPIKP
jgi:hypothetical protein